MKRISWKLTERHRQTQPHLLERPQLWSILSSSSADLIINGRFVTTKIKQQVCITTNGDAIYTHIVNPESHKYLTPSIETMLPLPWRKNSTPTKNLSSSFLTGCYPRKGTWNTTTYQQRQIVSYTSVTPRPIAIFCAVNMLTANLTYVSNYNKPINTCHITIIFRLFGKPSVKTS